MTLVLAAALGALAARPAAAQPSPSFELRAPTGTVTIGTPLELEGVARFPEKYALEAPQSPSTGAVVLLGVSAGSPSTAAGMKEQPVKVRVAAFELGVVTLPPLDWTLRTADGSAAFLRSPPVRFESVGPAPGPGDKEDIRDIHGPLAAPWWLWLIPLAALAAAIGGWRWWRTRRGEGGTAQGPAPDTRAPHERALDELRALLQAAPPAKEFYIELTEILRRYFEARFGVDAAVLTTSDLLRRLREAELDPGVLSRCREVFDRADLAKFARWTPTYEETHRDWSTAESIVKDTVPPLPVPDVSPAGRH